MIDPITTERLAIGRKVFFLDLREFVAALSRIMKCEDTLGEPAFAEYAEHM